MGGKKRIVILFDMSSSPPEDHNYLDHLKDDSWESERSVFSTLEKLDYEPHLIGIYDDVPRFIRDLRRLQPSLVFNMFEGFRGSRDYEPQVAGLLELMGIRYTGTKSLGLSLCQDKALSKKILAHHRIRVPKWVMSYKKRPLRSLKSFSFPAFVKPNQEEASEGISKDSFVENEKDCLDRIRFLHERFEADVIVEEFISGREFYASAVGSIRSQVFPIRELTFREFPEDAPRFATYKAKWDEDYRKKWGIRNESARGLSDELTKEIQTMAKKAFSVLGLSGYARFDLRLSDAGELVMLEANPNPSLGPEDDFIQSAQKAGFKYEQVIEKILDLA